VATWAREHGATELYARIQERETDSFAFAERRPSRFEDFWLASSL